MEGYIGEVKMFAGTFAPANWAFCQGQTLAISEHSALFAIIGTQFGGDGRINFQLPNLAGRATIGTGNGIGLSPRYQGQYGGYERIQLTQNQMPAHSHAVNCDTTSTGRDVSDTPTGHLPGKTSGDIGYGKNKDGQMQSDMVEPAGGNQSVENMQPWMALNYIICIEGIFPPRP